MTGKTAGAQKTPTAGTTSMGTSITPSGTANARTTAKVSPQPTTAPGGVAKASTHQGTVNTGNDQAKQNMLEGKLVIDECANNGSSAKGPKGQTDSADKMGNKKGPEKVSLQEVMLGAPVSTRSDPDSELVDMADMETDNEENRITKKRKQAPAPEHQSSEEDNVDWMMVKPQGEVLVDSLIKQHKVTLGRNQKL